MTPRTCIQPVSVLLARTSTVIPLEIWDCPGDITLEMLDIPLSHFSTLIFVIDIQVCALLLPISIVSAPFHL